MTLRFAAKWIVFGLACLPHANAAAEFDVATLKLSAPAVGDKIDINLGVARDGKVTLANVTLSECIMFAYGIVSDSLITGPDWIRLRAVRFDILGKAPADTDRETLTSMTQRLLADRLELRSHWEKKSMSYLALTIAKNGSNLKPAAGSDFNPAGAGRIARAAITMPLLATLLSRFERQTIVDETGLKGSFAVHLDWSPASQHADAPADTSRPSLPTALQDQLGLKLESRKGPVSIFIVDGALQVPKEN